MAHKISIAFALSSLATGGRGCTRNESSPLHRMARACAPVASIATAPPIADEAISSSRRGVELFMHIPNMHGSAWSWHLLAFWQSEAPGAVASGSRVESAFSEATRPKPSQNMTRVMFGHSGPDVLRRLGVSGYTTTMLRDAREIAYANGPWRSELRDALRDACAAVCGNIGQGDRDHTTVEHRTAAACRSEAVQRSCDDVRERPQRRPRNQQEASRAMMRSGRSHRSYRSRTWLAWLVRTDEPLFPWNPTGQPMTLESL